MKEFGEVLENVSLKNYNTYNIGGFAKYIIKPNNVDDLIKLIDYLKINNLKYFILGNGSNVILPDYDYDGVVILLSNLNNYDINGVKVSVESGLSLNVFINKLINNNLGGLENLSGIPGTIGGAIVQNAGCYGKTISDNLIDVTYLEDGKKYTISKEECLFDYRDSIFKHDKNKIILSATFNLFNKDKTEMLNIVRENNKKRIASQPLEYPNAGSVFRNPSNYSAGKLIDDLGLKNFNINDAYISDKHANFIINKNNATSKDIVDLINYIREKVKSEYKIELILEQEIIKY